MPDEKTDNNEAPLDGDSKPTITIAEKQSASANDGKPTITIAEKERGE